MGTPQINHNRRVLLIEDISDYQFYPASSTDIAFDGGGKGVGHAGDILRAIIVILNLTDPAGGVEIRDDTGPLIPLFAGGPTTIGSMTSFQPIWIPLGPRGIRSRNGPWRIRTTVGVEAMAIGKAT